MDAIKAIKAQKGPLFLQKPVGQKTVKKKYSEQYSGQALIKRTKKCIFFSAAASL